MYILNSNDKQCNSIPTRTGKQQKYKYCVNTDKVLVKVFNNMLIYVKLWL